MQAANILVVDDDELRAMLQEALKAWGHHVVAARSGGQALELAKTHVVEIVLCDLSMPGMGGLELLKRMKELYGVIDFVIMTGYPDVATAVEALLRRLGIDFIIQSRLRPAAPPGSPPELSRPHRRSGSTGNPAHTFMSPKTWGSCAVQTPLGCRVRAVKGGGRSWEALLEHFSERNG